MFAGKTKGPEVAWSDVSVVQTQVRSILIDTPPVHSPSVCLCLTVAPESWGNPPHHIYETHKSIARRQSL